MMLVPCLLSLFLAQSGLENPLKAHQVVTEKTQYKGKSAVKVTPAPGNGAEDLLAILTGGPAFHNGTIEVEVAGRPGSGASDTARGFVGIAFRVAQDLKKFECIYIRPTNGRADDQERRNHSTQYISYPEYPWHRLRKETPSKYESYVDLVPGEWTKLRIVVDGAKARLYVHGSEQPALIVNDLKHGSDAAGSIALWVGPGTEAYFANLRVTP